MNGLAIRPLTRRSIEGHDVLLDTAHDFLDSIVESSGQHNQGPSGSHLEECGGNRFGYDSNMRETNL